MQFNSLQFLIFFPIVVLVYLIVPKKARYLWLLLASYFFYMGWNPKYALLIALSTVTTYLAGLMIGRENEKESVNVGRKKLYVAASFLLNLGILFFFKYFNFAMHNLQAVLGLLHISITERTVDVLLPVGISFYTFQALGYTIDVYRGDIKAEKNLLRYALFVSFFPQLVAGPIERSFNLIHQVNEVDNMKLWDTDRIRDGLLLMFWGLFEKLMVADRAAIAVDAVYNQFGAFGRGEILLTTVLFAFQIYCDFDAYSNIARGAAKICGFTLMKNFRQPYFATSIADFWRRWHISLSTWFRDYLYIPLGGSRVSMVRNWFNLMVVFLVSGAWHGASWHYILWGGIHGAYQVAAKWKNMLFSKLGVGKKRENGSGTEDGEEKRENRFTAGLCHICKVIVTFVFADLAWAMFRVNSIGDLKGMILTAIARPEFHDWKGMELTPMQWTLLAISILILSLVDLAHEKGVSFCEKIGEKNMFAHVLIFTLLIGVILIFGVYGASYDTSQFIYFQF